MATPTEQPATPFALQIEFSGICLFVRDSAGTRLEVLMPPTGKHAASGNGSGHCVAKHAVQISYERRFESGSADDSALVTLDWEDGVIDLRGLAVKNDPLVPEFSRVANITRIVGRKTARRERAAGRMHLGHGRMCPPDVCGEHPAAEFTLAPEAGGASQRAEAPGEPFLNTVPWLIREVVETVDGTAGLTLTIREKDGTTRESHVLRPVGDIIRIFVSHQPVVEPAELKPGDRDEHFAAFYDLFDDVKVAPVPVLVRLPVIEGEVGAGAFVAGCVDALMVEP